ncbi:P-loop containing nucleoside triphosphate hydrolase protein [Mycena olivaceomarginata]|nr:P-loop containing nucleoside triphosphate hydrolase protein [Mycena olivaceomarginata]
MDHWTVAVLGSGNVGKTVLAIQTYDPTIEDSYRKQLVVDNHMCYMDVIDTAGQEEYTILRGQWVRPSQAFVLVYSITLRSTLDRLEVFLESDNEHEVSQEEGAALVLQHHCEFIETLAKEARNVE